MSKRVRFSDTAEATTHKFPKYDDASEKKFVLKNDQELHQGIHPGSRFKDKNSLDSDDEEEDVKEKYEKLTEEDVEGAEDDYEGGDEERITPFNLKEEMEEGDFDVQGNYHFKKEKVIRDNWLDNIDWVQIKKKTAKEDAKDSSSDEEERPPLDELQTLKKMLSLMEPGETVTKALRRLGGKQNDKKKGKRPWQKQKKYDLNANDESEKMDEGNAEEEQERKQKFLELTGLVDEMTGAGNYDVYTDSFEKFQFKINSMEVAKKARQPDIPEEADDDDALDIFASSIDNEKNDKPVSTSQEKESEDNTVKWEFRWKNEESEQVHGPFTSQQMMEWQEQNYFQDGVYVRRTDRPDSQFYSSKRVDFDLYT